MRKLCQFRESFHSIHFVAIKTLTSQMALSGNIEKGFIMENVNDVISVCDQFTVVSINKYINEDGFVDLTMTNGDGFTFTERMNTSTYAFKSKMEAIVPKAFANPITLMVERDKQSNFYITKIFK